MLVATDVLSEGQNLQDCNVVVNYDLPWAIIRLIQRAGRVDRIGQQAETIFAIPFCRPRVWSGSSDCGNGCATALKENAEVVGTDEAFFEDDANDQVIVDLYNEKAGILDGEEESEVDLASYAYQIWKNAITHDPSLRRTFLSCRHGFFGKPLRQRLVRQQGALVYVRTGEGNDSLAWYR